MLRVMPSISSLLVGTGILLVGTGLLGTLLAVRASLEHFPDAITGLVMSAFFVGYVLGNFICPELIKRVRHIRAFAAMAAIASTTAIVHGLIVNPIAWGLLRIVTGVCVMGLYMVIESWLNLLATPPLRGRLFGAYMTVTLLALALGQFLLVLADVRDLVLFAVVAMFLSMALVPVALTRIVEPTPVEAPRLQLQYLYAVSPQGVIGALVAGLCSGAFWGMGPVFAHSVGLSDTGVAAFMSATILGGALLQWPIGHFSDQHDRRKVLAAVCLSGAALASMASVILGFSKLGLFASVFLFGGLMFTLYSLSVAHVNDHLQTEQVLEATRGLLLIFGAGAAVGPSAAGLLMNVFGPRSLFVYFATAMALLGLFTLHRMRVRAPVPTEEQAAFVPMVRTSQAALEMDPRAEVEPELDLK